MTENVEKQVAEQQSFVENLAKLGTKPRVTLVF
jgi:hypothetical protein